MDQDIIRIFFCMLFPLSKTFYILKKKKNMDDPMKIFFTMKSVIENCQSGEGCKLGYVPACVSVCKDVKNAVKRNEDDSDISSDEDDTSSDDEDDAEKTDVDSDTEREQKEEKKRATKERRKKLYVAFKDMQKVLQRKVPHSYCCGGSIPLPVLLEEKRTKGNDDVPIETIGVSCNTTERKVFTIHDLLCLDVPGLRELTSPSGFGDLATQQTRVDENVRKARELKLDSFQFKKYYADNKEANTDLHLERFEWYINSLLTNCNVSLSLHKLNFYEKGGFFQPHVDTPTHGSKQLGTCILCLPVEHTGGELIIRHAGESHTFDFASQSKDCLQWCAFFGDCIHEVKPVTSGTRLTVTFDLLKTSSRNRRYEPFACEKQFHQPLDMCQHYLQTCFNPVLKNLQELLQKDSKYVGLLLEHRYPLDICEQPTHLKGKDASLYEHLKKFYNVSIQTVIHRDQFIYFEALNYKDDRKTCVFRFTQADYEAYKNGSNPPPSEFSSTIPFIPMVTGKEHCLLKTEQEGADYSGNEALATSTDVVYYSTALLVQLATPQKRQRVNIE